MMGSNQCPELEELAALIDGKLTGDARTRVLEHSDGCENCRLLLAEAMHVLDELEEGQAADATPADQETKPAPVRPLPYSRNFSVALSGALAIAALLVLTFGLDLFKRKLDPEVARAHWWRDRFAPAIVDAETDRAHTVFREVTRAADLKAELIIIKHDKLLAMALQERAVLISDKVLELCYQAGLERGDARLALVLGHELAHIQAGNTLHAFAAASLPENVAGYLRRFKPADLVSDEQTADRLGMLYADLAGYHPADILDRRGDFFAAWTDQPIQRVVYPWAEPEKRAEALLTELSAIAQELPSFHSGIQFYEAGSFAEARVWFERFYQKFPAREVANNIGLTYYQEAAAKLSRKSRLRFRLPVHLDKVSLAASSGPRGDSADPALSDPIFRSLIEKALAAFEEAQRRDPEYEPARRNRLATLLLAGRPEVVVAEQGSANTDEGCRQLWTLALFELGQHAEAIQQQRALAWDQDPVNAYNLARMLSESQPAEAELVWRRFLDLEPEGIYADEARRYLSPPAL